MNYQRIRQNPKQFLSITSLSLEKFDQLLPLFESAWKDYIEHFTLDGLPRVRPYQPSENEFLPLIEEKLFFILSYQKNASLQEFFSAAYDSNQSETNKWIHILSPILERSLDAYMPQRSLEQIDLAAKETYLIDATERPVQRDTYAQESYYSGKKKRHTVKNIAICTLVGAFVFLSPTVFGRIHDKKMIDTMEIKTQNIKMYADLAFIGWKTSEQIELILPHKKPRNTRTEKKELSEKQKEFNREQARIRVKIENVFAHLKTMRILKDTIRNYKEGFKDRVISTAAALYNFRKSFKIKNSTL